MKGILISIKPKYVADILNGHKTIEIRKTMPKCDLPIDVYIYCTKETQLVKYANKYVATDFFKGLECPPKTYNGKVVAKFTLNKVEEILPLPHTPSLFCPYNYLYYVANNSPEKLKKSSCVDFDGLHHYLKGKNGYAWHISNLEIFDEPRELGEFDIIEKHNNCSLCPFKDDYEYTHCRSCEEIKPLTKAPQSYCFIETGE